MYPGYKPREVMDEYAITFFALLNEGYRIRYRHYQMLGQLICLPDMEEGSRKKFSQQLEWASTDPSDILKPSGTYATSEDLKKFFGKF